MADGGKAPDDEDEAQAIPADIEQGDSFTVGEGDVRVKDGKTTPPKPYTDATLLSAMEHAGRSIEDRELKAAIEDDSMHSGGLGTPATRASMIEKLIKAKYIRRRGKTLSATERGETLIDIVCDSLKTPELTAKWELSLSHVERGEGSLSDFLSGIEGYTAAVVSDLEGGFDPAQAAAVSGREELCRCPACGAPIVLSRSGKQWQCSSSKWAGKEEGWRLLQGCGVKLNIVQNGKKLTKSQAKAILSGKTVHLTGLAKKDGSGTFDTDAKLGEAPYTGFVEFCRGERPDGGTGGAGRTGTRRARGKR